MNSKPIHERLLLLVLAAIQFTTIVDFLIIMPLGPQYMRVFHLTPGQFGLIVSAYAVSAGISGFVAGCVLDRFDRKWALLGLYSMFCLGTLFCATAPSYPMLVAARAIAGAFGGICSAMVMTIIGDVIPYERRGRAMGLVMSAFSVASIAGVPIGLVLATHFGWHVPFFALTALSAGVLAAAVRALPNLREHLQHATEQHPLLRMLTVLWHVDHRMAFLLTIMLTCSGFVIFPYLSTYMVANVGLTEQQLPLIYLCGGACTIVSMNWIGRWSDRIGKLRAFTRVSVCAALPILVLTNLHRVPLPLALLASTALMVAMSGRMVPATALMTGSIESRYRGGFMSINNSLQQFTSGIAAYASGRVMGQAPGGEMTHFPVIGVFSAACVLACIHIAGFLKSPEKKTAMAEPPPGELASPER